MQPLWILLIGVVIVIGGVLVLRLHAFLSLVLAALTVGAITPQEAVETFEIRDRAVSIVAVDHSQRCVLLELDALSDYVGTKFVVLRPGGPQNQSQAVAVLTVGGFDKTRDRDGKAVNVAVASVAPGSQTDLGPVTPGDLAIDPLALQAARAAAKQTVGERVANAFGGTCAKIGILIAMAAIVGKCLLDSGAADKIVRSALRVVGESRAATALLGSSFLLGIPVFFDTVFYLMIPLGKALRAAGPQLSALRVEHHRRRHDVPLAGPSDAGPPVRCRSTFRGSGADDAGGGAIGLCAAPPRTASPSALNARWDIPLRESADCSLTDLEALSRRDERDLPPLFASLLPIVLPVLLIAGYTVLNMVLDAAAIELSPVGSRRALGNENIALGSGRRCRHGAVGLAETDGLSDGTGHVRSGGPGQRQASSSSSRRRAVAGRSSSKPAWRA